MAQFLQGYGEKEARRGRILKWIVLSVAALAAIAGALYFGLRNYKEKHQVSEFLEDLRRKDYKTAYSRWGCTYDKPCRDYNYQSFLEDWSKLNAGQAAVVDVKSCGSGVIEIVRFPSQEVQLWVERDDQVLGYSPWTVTPNPNRIQNLLWEITENCAPYTRR